jgi:sugar lactone lactonase YvrE
LYKPFFVALNPSNTLFITDQFNHRVQKWLMGASSGTTVAGQSNASTGSTLEYLNYPADLIVDANDSLYIVDSKNHRVVFWANDASSGTLVAGNGKEIFFPAQNINIFIGTAGNASNQLSSPIGLAFDRSSGTFYISDTDNNRIMKYSLGVLSGTLVAGNNGAGTSNNQLYTPQGLYFESATNSLLIVNFMAHNIVRWVLGASSWTLVIGSSNGSFGVTSTLLYYHTDVTLDSMGNMYVSDEGNERIQFFLRGQSSGTTVAGVTGTSGSTPQLLDTPSSVAIDNQSNIYVTDYMNYRVQKFVHHQ